MQETSSAENTASGATLVNSAIFFLRLGPMGRDGPAQQDLGLDADLAQLHHRVLGGLGLQLAGGADVRHQRDVHGDGVLGAHLEAQLPDRLEEGQRLDVADRAADLDDDDVDVLGALEDAGLDLVGDVGNDLHGAAQVFTAPLLLDDRSGRSGRRWRC